ncbi:MAG: hypothetical protein KatS3mg040_0044 [Candidatus Kapaibacterium sp.]|nr:MAG: hypothetical protein KatS3mg040_0044 [Candidatus Kapabacteria bacterium]
MEREAVLRWFGERLERDTPLTIPEAIFDALTPDLARELAERYRRYGLMRLPAHEQRFFEWLRQRDPAVWSDLWGGEQEPYVVSLSFLEALLDRRKGFPICDLVGTDNYYFFPAMLEWTQEARDYAAAVRERFERGQPLSTEQLLVIELLLGGAVDIWHFAYHHNIELEDAKQAVRVLVEDKVLPHLRSAEQLAPFLR